MQVALQDPPLNKGIPVFGNVVSDREFQGVMNHGLFMNLVPDPRKLEGANVKHHQEFQSVATLRQRVQRLVQGAKGKNVEPYARYITTMAKTGEGFTPQIVLWCPEELMVQEDENTGFAWILIPHGMRFVALDGDTQTTARHAANFDGLLNKQTVKVVIKHGTPEDAAAQIFADCNSQGVKVTTSMAIGLDSRDDATQLAKHVEHNVSTLKGKVNRQKRQLSASDKDLLTISALRASVVCFIEGISGVQNQTKSVEIPDAHLPLLRQTAEQWYRIVVDTLNGALTAPQRANTFASAPSVWCAIGALGRETLVELVGDDFSKSATPAAIEHAFHAVAQQRLSGIDWARSNDAWLTVGAKKGASGVVTLGGPKETGSLVFKGLKDGVLNKPSLMAA